MAQLLLKQKQALEGTLDQAWSRQSPTDNISYSLFDRVRRTVAYVDSGNDSLDWEGEKQECTSYRSKH